MTTRNLSTSAQIQFAEALVAIVPVERSSNPLSKFRLLALPTGSTIPQEVRINVPALDIYMKEMTFTTKEQAEAWIERNLKTVVIVQSEDLTEEVRRRKQPAQPQELSAYPPREVTDTERLSWGL